MGDGRGRRTGLIIRIDFARDEAEVKMMTMADGGNHHHDLGTCVGR